MKVINCKLPRNLKEVELHAMADLHYGDELCDKRLIQERINYIRDTENAYCILNGDLMDNATKTSIGDSYSAEMNPMEQIENCVSLFSCIKHKIIAIQPGNHENRTYRKEGIDITKLMAAQLGLIDRYSNTSSFIFLRCGEQARGMKESNGSGKVRQVCYTIYVLHGSGGGRKEGAKAIRLADMASIVDSDILIHSHTHMPMIMKQAYHRVDMQNSSIAKVDKLFVNTAAALDYGGYGESFEYKPSSKDNPIIYLNGTKKQFSAKL